MTSCRSRWTANCNRPLIDALMAFVQATQGRGGWPLNVFLTPEGYPLYAVLYVPPASFVEVIGKINALWQEDPARIATIARQHGPRGFADKSPATGTGVGARARSGLRADGDWTGGYL